MYEEALQEAVSFFSVDQAGQVKRSVLEGADSGFAPISVAAQLNFSHDDEYIDN
jgi:hypothetical protein